MRKDKIEFDYSLLKGRIRKLFGGYEAFAASVGCTVTTVTLKLNGHTDFSSQDIRRWCELLSIPNEHLHEYFFKVIV